MRSLKTLKGAEFIYEGSVATGTEINYGHGFKAAVSSRQYTQLLTHFSNSEIPVRASRTAAVSESLGSWLQANVTRTAIASYVAPILVAEGYAKPGTKHGWIKLR